MSEQIDEMAEANAQRHHEVNEHLKSLLKQEREHAKQLLHFFEKAKPHFDSFLEASSRR
jgi:hypothetical protein